MVLLLCSLTMVNGCAAWNSTMRFLGFKDDHNAQPSAEAMAMKALDDFNHGKYEKALSSFEELKNKFPFSQFSLLAELKTADCKYYLEAYDEAVLLYEEFENNHPTNEAIPYVMFQIGMSHFQQIDTIDRDPAGAYAAIQSFSRLLRSFPVSPYSEEAKAKILAAKTFLASHEMYVANFYIGKEEYKQAERRLQYILDTYPDTPVAPRAKNLLAAVRSDNPPKRGWFSWLWGISLPNWKDMKGSITPGAGVGGAPQ